MTEVADVTKDSITDDDLGGYKLMIQCLKYAILALNADPDNWVIAVTIQDIIGCLQEMKWDIKYGDPDDPFAVPSFSDAASVTAEKAKVQKFGQPQIASATRAMMRNLV